jgi:hypothetical protein
MPGAFFTRLPQPCYAARGAVSAERLAEDESGDLVYTCPRSWSDGTTDHTRTVGAVREVGSVSVTPTGPPRTLSWGSGTTQHAARLHRAHRASAGSRGKGSPPRIAALEPGPTAPVGLCPRPGNRSWVSAGDAAPHRHHHPWASDLEAPALSATRCRPPSHRPRAYPLRPLRLGCSLSHRSLWGGLGARRMCRGAPARSGGRRSGP